MKLTVNPIACAGHGACAELLPELIELDEWGYPLIDQREVPNALERQARKAVTNCPALALKLRLERVVPGMRLGRQCCLRRHCS
jgi:ferredoxin